MLAKIDLDKFDKIWEKLRRSLGKLDKI